RLSLDCSKRLRGSQQNRQRRWLAFVIRQCNLSRRVGHRGPSGEPHDWCAFSLPALPPAPHLCGGHLRVTLDKSWNGLRWLWTHSDLRELHCTTELRRRRDRQCLRSVHAHHVCGTRKELRSNT